MPVHDGSLLGHLGKARQFALLEADQQSRLIVRMQIMAAPPHEPGSFPRWLREHGVQVVIASRLGQRALDNLVHHGLEVRVGQAGALVDNLVTGYFAGHLARMHDGCDHQHDGAAIHECQLAACLQAQPTNPPDDGVPVPEP
jgi:ATP-binding protein involved in chromosome partitioning